MITNKTYACAVTNVAVIYMEIDTEDFQKYRNKLFSELVNLENLLNKSHTKLYINDNFSKKAPKHIVEQEIEKAENYSNRINKIIDILKQN
jgi:valyl-tRNA synthetase